MRSASSSTVCLPRWATRRTTRPTIGPRLARIAAELGVPLMPWQRLVADVAGEYDEATGLPAYREVIVTVPRQSGKTTLELVTMVDRALMWDIPRRIAYTAQTGLDARQKVINDFEPALRRSPLRVAMSRVLRGAAETAIEFANGSRIEVLNSGEEAGHGRTLDLGIVDEAFADEDDRREQAIVPAMTTRPDAQVYVYSTQGTPRSTFFNRKVATGRAVAEAGITEGIAYFEWSAADDADPADPSVWAGCMPALGHTIDLATVEHARLSMSDGDFRRAYLNQMREHEARWLPLGAWEARRHPGKLVLPPDGADIVLGFDGSYNGDSTAIVGCTLDGHLFKVAVWERPHDAADGWVVPRADVERAIVEAFRRWHVIGLGVDRARWYRETQEWADRYGEDVVHEVPQTPARMSEACASFYKAVVTGGLTHDGDPDLARHIAGAVTKETPDGAYIRKEGRHSPLKIDLAVAAVLAHDQRLRVVPKPAMEPMIRWA